MNDETSDRTVFEQARAEFLAGLGCHDRGDHAQAQRHYEASLRLLPGRPSTLINLAAVQLALGQAAGALASADAALAAEPGSADALLHRGTALARLGRAADALISFDRLIAIDPANPLAWSHRGSLLREMHRHEEAAAAFGEALRHGANPELHRFFLAGLGSGTPPPAPPRGYVERLFDDYAADFDAHLVGTLGYRAHHELVALVRQHVPRARFDRALDLGCGTGLCGPLLRPLAQRLTGLDVSAPMLERSRSRGVYDQLVRDDAVQFLAGTAERFELIVACDVLIYLGDPAPLFAAVERTLAQRGVFAFSVESIGDDEAGPGWRLLPSLRYAHSRALLLRLAQAHGLSAARVAAAAVRNDQRSAVDGLYLVLERTPTAG